MRLPGVATLAAGHAWVRVVLGTTALIAPGPVGAAFGIGGDSRLAARHLGARDLVVGAGMVWAHGSPAAAAWYRAAAAVDALDAVVVLVASRRGDLPRGRAVAVAALAGTSAAVGLALAGRTGRASG